MRTLVPISLPRSLSLSLSLSEMTVLHLSLVSSLGSISNKSIGLMIRHRPRLPIATGTATCCVSSQSSSSSNSPPPPPPPPPGSTTPTQKGIATNSFLEPRPTTAHKNYKLTTDSTTTSSNIVVQLTPESSIERVIFDFRFLAILAVAGSLAGSLLCFLNGCIYIVDAYKVYWTCCTKGIHTGQMVLRLVEAIDVYLAGTVLLIFGMGLYGLFISNVPPGLPPNVDRALRGSSLFGMFALKVRPKWMKISSLDELKTKVGHVIVMILLVKMFERSKMVVIATGLDLLSYSVCIFLSSASLYILHNLHKSD